MGLKRPLHEQARGASPLSLAFARALEKTGAFAEAGRGRKGGEFAGGHKCGVDRRKKVRRTPLDSRQLLPSKPEL